MIRAFCLRIDSLSILIVIFSLFCVLGAAQPINGSDKPNAAVDFARDVLPIFQNRCYACHDGKKQVSGYRLDVRSRAMAGGESEEAAIVAGKSAESPLLHRVRRDDESLAMPPEDEGQPLTAAEVKTLTAWIDAGAVWPDELANEDRVRIQHWAFEAPQKPELPGVSLADWAKSPIDHFVLSTLEKNNLKPSSEAVKETLIRRLSLDLTGLPPTVDEVEAFTRDSRLEAYSQLVERLLASPHYGERWARVWLDAARYADSDGFEKDQPRSVWFYRDWVINAFNTDMPYDRFVIEQVAGDMLPNATQDQLVATGFLRNAMTNEEGGIDPEQFRIEAMIDRMDAIGKSVLGLTIQCAQCHNHKFDPLKQEEYYRMFACLNNAHESIAPVYLPEQRQQRDQILEEISQIEQELKTSSSDWQARMAAWEADVAGNQPEWQVLTVEADPVTANGQKYVPQEDGSLAQLGFVRPSTRVKFSAPYQGRPITAIRFELLTDPRLPMNGPGRAVNGMCRISEFACEIAPQEGNAVKKITFVSATADAETPTRMFKDKNSNKRAGPVTFAIDGNEKTAWDFDMGPGRRNQPRKAVFIVSEPISGNKEQQLTFYLSHKVNSGNGSQSSGRFRISVTSDPNPIADPLPAEVRQVISIPAAERSAEQTAKVFSYWRTLVPAWQAANERIEKLWQQHPEPYSQLALQERDEPRKTHLFKRGNFLQPEREVAAGVPEFLHPMPAGVEANRLTFARWLVDRESPTTARSLVNRVWQAYFGTGLVGSSEDLGMQSEAPSHPDLLDWLAVELMENGWSIKHLHRLIVNSAVYRQTSTVSENLLATDPYNRLLARGARFRLDAELIRDCALAESGLLDRTIGGKSVYPIVPMFLMQQPASFSTKSWPTSSGKDRYRRALYTFRYRTVPYPFLEAFDAPNGDFSCVRRSRSNTPLQALASLNEPIAMECAKGLAKRILQEAAHDDRTRISLGFKICAAREPTTDEVQELIEFVHRQTQREEAIELSGAKGTEANTAADSQLAIWTALARVLLNLDETITRE